MSAYCLEKKGTVWPRAKIEKHFLSILGEIEKERVTGKKPYKMAMEKLPLELSSGQGGSSTKWPWSFSWSMNAIV